MRTGAEADVLAPERRRYSVRVIRVLWPRHSPVLDGASNVLDGAGNFVPGGAIVGAAGDVVSLFASRRVWSVRVFGEAARFRLPPLVYGEEWRDRDDAVQRAREIAEGLAVGQRP
jgi:hypothetical protein